MAEIISKIIAEATGTRYARDPLVFSNLETSYNEHTLLTEYYMGVRLGQKLLVDDSVPDQREEAIRVIRRGLTETIFGEFRAPLSRAGYTLYSRDFDAAKHAIEEIEKRMFYS